MPINEKEVNGTSKTHRANAFLEQLARLKSGASANRNTPAKLNRYKQNATVVIIWTGWSVATK